MTYRYVPPVLYRLGQFALLIEALVRGVSYFLSGVPQTQTQAVASLSAPVAVWGGLFIVFAVSGVAGEFLMDKGHSEHRYWPSFMAHSGLMCIYVGMAISASFALLDDAGQSSFGTGLISPADFLLLALWHWIFARRRKHV